MSGTPGQKKEGGPMGPDWAKLLTFWKRGASSTYQASSVCLDFSFYKFRHKNMQDTDTQ